MTTYYITKYALTSGIQKLSGDDIKITEHNALSKRGNLCGGWNERSHHYNEGDWHRTEAEAIAKARDMRDRKIASLHKQIAKLGKMTFEVFR